MTTWAFSPSRTIVFAAPGAQSNGNYVFALPTLVLPGEVLNIIAAALAELPFKLAAPIIQDLNRQVAAQSNKALNQSIGFRNRTPAPPPFSSMNSTPAASRAARMAFMVLDRQALPDSNETSVRRETWLDSANSSRDNPTSALAALDCAGEISLIVQLPVAFIS